MADILRIRGNFFTVYDDTPYTEYIRNPLSETTYRRVDEDNFQFLYKEPNVADTNELFILGGNDNIAGNPNWTTFLYSDLINFVTGLAFISGDDLDDFLADKFGTSQVNVVVQQLPIPIEVWHPTPVLLGAFIPNGVTTFPALGAGALFTFSANQDDEILGNIDLDLNGIEYGGEAMILHLHWLLFNAVAGGTRNVKLDLEWAFVSNGEDNYTKIDGTHTLDIDVSGLPEREQMTTEFPPIVGIAGAEILQLTVRRNGTGAGADNYAGDVDLYALGLINT